MKNNFLSEFNCFIKSFFNVKPEVFEESLGAQVSAIIQRSVQEKSYWLDKIAVINTYTREQAVNELIANLKINEKLAQIDAYVRSISI